jgi:hypothetical protein
VARYAFVLYEEASDQMISGALTSGNEHLKLAVKVCHARHCYGIAKLNFSVPLQIAAGYLLN